MSPNTKNGKKLKIYHFNNLLEMFPDFASGEDSGEEDHYESLLSSY